jgi:hypothetical protein
MNLKKRQEHHTQLCKELNLLGVKIDIRLLTTQGEKPLEILLINKIIESKHTAVFLAQHQPTHTLYCLKRLNIS